MKHLLCGFVLAVALTSGLAAEGLQGKLDTHLGASGQATFDSDHTSTLDLRAGLGYYLSDLFSVVGDSNLSLEEGRDAGGYLEARARFHPDTGRLVPVMGVGVRYRLSGSGGDDTSFLAELGLKYFLTPKISLDLTTFRDLDEFDFDLDPPDALPFQLGFSYIWGD